MANRPRPSAQIGRGKSHVNVTFCGFVDQAVNWSPNSGVRSPTSTVMVAPGAKVSVDIPSKCAPWLVAFQIPVTCERSRTAPSCSSTECHLMLSPHGQNRRTTLIGHVAPKRIIKTGSTLVRHLLVTAANYIMRDSSADTALKRHGERICARGGKVARRKAKTAVARKLAVLMVAMLKSGKPYDDGRAAMAEMPGKGSAVA